MLNNITINAISRRSPDTSKILGSIKFKTNGPSTIPVIIIPINPGNFNLIKISPSNNPIVKIKAKLNNILIPHFSIVIKKTTLHPYRQTSSA